MSVILCNESSTAAHLFAIAHPVVSSVPFDSLCNLLLKIQNLPIHSDLSAVWRRRWGGIFEPLASQSDLLKPKALFGKSLVFVSRNF